MIRGLTLQRILSLLAIIAVLAQRGAEPRPSRRWSLILYAIRFFRQIPHFLALAWIYRDDYARAGFQIQGTSDPSGFSSQVVFSLALLFPVSLIPYVARMPGKSSLLGAGVLGSLFLYLGLQAANNLSEKTCRRLFLFSLVYLPAIFAMVVIS